jgi:hypothetical protein
MPSDTLTNCIVVQKLKKISKSSYFSGNDFGSWQITGSRESNKITERRHSVSTTSPGIRNGKWGQRVNHVVDLAQFGLLWGQWDTNSSPSRAYVLEGRSSWHAQGSIQLSHQLPSIQGITQVDVARRAIDNLRKGSAVKYSQYNLKFAVELPVKGSLGPVVNN